MRLPFCILNVRGDVLDDGEICFMGATQTLRAARRRIDALAKLSPGQYVIYNGETGERLPLAKCVLATGLPQKQQVNSVVSATLSRTTT